MVKPTPCNGLGKVKSFLRGATEGQRVQEVLRNRIVVVPERGQMVALVKITAAVVMERSPGVNLPIFQVKSTDSPCD